ncbi:MarR family winged helix-turn-helix transcriptional regulator [Nocardia thailandica]|uniref:MarR family winged helix-turn-helix transcriptional regulator n=1 Tax=Nocardia thailandica TaxID=257275 RepID=UPI0002F9240A|nr:MarR family transcriptional regulator [Nocardia thailandica]
MKSLHDNADRQAAASAATDKLFELTEVLGAMMERGMAERGLTQARARLLWQLHHHGPLTQRALADLLGVTPRNVTGLLDGLATDGYIERRPHPSDRRPTLVTLTHHGATFAETLRTQRNEMAAALLDGLTRDQVQSFFQTLDVVVGRLHGIAPTC